MKLGAPHPCPWPAVPSGGLIISRVRGYHGTNYTAGERAGSAPAPNKDGLRRTPRRRPVQYRATTSRAACRYPELSQHSDRIAAVLTERCRARRPSIRRPTATSKVPAISVTQHGALLIFARGDHRVRLRLGHVVFAGQYYGVQPDMTTCCQGWSPRATRPLGGVIVGAEVCAAGARGRPSSHPPSRLHVLGPRDRRAPAGLANLAIIERART
jgi:adenosylmethionine-8-amino-7-oxononanoate aminotransferase